MKIAIIGTGISGLGAAFLLNPHHAITVYEINSTVGGHSRTIQIKTDNRSIPVDTGFIVFNKRNYPYLCGLFEHLNVPIETSDMSFGASIQQGWLEYSSKGLFAQKRNLLRPRFWRIITDVLRFNKKALSYLDASPDITLRDLLHQLNMSDWFAHYYLQAMGAAIWSCSVETILDFPAKTFIRFFNNHGLLTVNGHPQWYTVTGGSTEYIKRLTQSFTDKIKTSCGVVNVTRTTEGVLVTDSQGQTGCYDHVVFACHADQALAMLADPLPAEKNILGAFTYQSNHIVVHSDINLMPRRRKSWASWIYLADQTRDQKPIVSLSYWMNNLQNLQTETPVLVTLNPGHTPDPATVYDRHIFRHPVFDTAAVKAQNDLASIQGTDRISYCGAWQSYGFHEDGLASAVRVANSFGITPPWL